MHALKRHVSCVHEGNKHFKCEKCHKTFGQLSNLKDHMVYVHENEKNFQCDQCDYRCKRVYELKKHIFNVHDEEKTQKEWNYLKIHFMFESPKY